MASCLYRVYVRICFVTARQVRSCYANDKLLVALQSAIINGAHYPQRLYKCFIINAPAVFKLVWRIAQPMMSELTISKIRMLGSKQA